MMSTQLSTCLTVEDFFSQANWQGLDLPPTTIEPETNTVLVDQIETPHISLSVANFFARNNWQGRKQMTTQVLDNQQQIPSYSQGVTPTLTMSVAEFFQRMVWRERQSPNVIGAMPEIKSPETSNPQSESLNVSDLSDLF